MTLTSNSVLSTSVERMVLSKYPCCRARHTDSCLWTGACSNSWKFSLITTWTYGWSETQANGSPSMIFLQFCVKPGLKVWYPQTLSAGFVSQGSDRLTLAYLPKRILLHPAWQTDHQSSVLTAMPQCKSTAVSHRQVTAVPQRQATSSQHQATSSQHQATMPLARVSQYQPLVQQSQSAVSRHHATIALNLSLCQATVPQCQPTGPQRQRTMSQHHAPLVSLRAIVPSLKQVCHSWVKLSRMIPKWHWPSANPCIVLDPSKRRWPLSVARISCSGPSFGRTFWCVIWWCRTEITARSSKSCRVSSAVHDRKWRNFIWCSEVPLP